MAEKPKESKPRRLVGKLTGLVYEYVCGRLNGKQVAAELRAIADWIDGGGKEPAEHEIKPPKPPVTTQIEERVFAYWAHKFGKRGAKFTQGRRLKIRARLREGYSERDILRAIDGCHDSAFHRGENDGGKAYDDLELICRNGAKLEGFRDMAPSAPAPMNETVIGIEIEERINRLQREADAALKEGRTSAYNEAQNAIRQLRKPRAAQGAESRSAAGNG